MGRRIKHRGQFLYLLQKVRVKYNFPKNRRGECLILKRIKDSYLRRSYDETIIVPSDKKVRRPKPIRCNREQYNLWFIESLLDNCPLTGQEFVFELRANKNLGPGPHPQTPSIDKIDSALDYTLENMRLVVFWANSARGECSDTEFCQNIREAYNHIKDEPILIKEKKYLVEIPHTLDKFLA